VLSDERNVGLFSGDEASGDRRSYFPWTRVVGGAEDPS